MKKLIPMFLLLSLNAHAEAVHCKASKGLARPIDAVVNFDEKNLELEGNKMPFLATSETKIEGVAQFLAALEKCDKTEKENSIEALECGNKARNEFIPDGVAQLDAMAYLGVSFLNLYQSAPEEERMVEVKFPLSSIRSAKAYQIDQAFKFGVPGIYEYFDEKGDLLGRFLIVTPMVVSCE